MKAKIWGIPCFQALWLLSIAVLEGPGGWRMLDGNAIFQPVVINHDCRDALQERWLLAPIRWISSKKISSSSSNSGNGYLLAGNYCLARDSVLRPTAAHSASLRVCPSGTYKRSCRECQWRRWTGEPPHQPRRSNGILFFFFFFFFIFIVFIFDVFISIIFIFLFFVLAQTLVIWKRVITRFGKTVWISSPAFSAEPGVVETAGNLHSHLPCLDPRN